MEEAPPPPSLPAPEAITRDEVFDDFEDGDLDLWLPDGEGQWTAAGASEAVTVDEDGADGSGRALRIAPTAEQVTARLTVKDAPLRRHDYSSCSGLSLFARHDGSGEATLAIALTSTTGTAVATASVSADWELVRIAFDDFEPGALGAPRGAGGAGPGGDSPGGQSPGNASAAGAAGAPSANAGTPSEASDAATPSVGSLDPASVQALDIAALGDSDLLIDEVRLTDCELLPLNPPLPTPSPLGDADPAETPVARHGQLRVRGNRLVDQSGEPVVLKGVSSMWLNWETDGYAESKHGLEYMRDNWNLSVIRAAMGVEESGGYVTAPQSSAAKVRTIIENAIELGVYVIVDWHTHDAPPNADLARGFFDAIAQDYGDHPNVIYELFNEPLQVSWSSVIKPYAESVVAIIRARDPDNLVVLGTPNWSQFPDEASDNPVGGSNLLYTMHFYACTHEAWLRDRTEQALANGVAVFVTEWGGTNADGGRDNVVCEPETITWLDWMDEHGLSGAAWKLDNCNGESSCLLSGGTPVNGDWTDDYIHGHAPLVIDWMRR